MMKMILYHNALCRIMTLMRTCILLVLTMMLMACHSAGVPRHAVVSSARYTLGHSPLVVSVVTDIHPDEVGFEAWKTRFDRTACVTQVRLDEQPMIDHQGMPDEIGILGVGVLGYEEAKVGEPYLKIGVGLLQRSRAGAYEFSQDDPLIQAIPVKITGMPEENRLIAQQQSPKVNGYAYKWTKTFHVDSHAGQLTLDYELANVGDKAFTFEHYNHQYLTMGGRSLDQDHLIELGHDIPAIPHACMHMQKHRLVIEGQPDMSSFIAVNEPLSVTQANLRITYAPTGLRVTVTGDSPAYRMVYYITPTSFTPERFYRNTIAPGATAHWQMRYTWGK
jgi:hypothetical protein